MHPIIFCLALAFIVGIKGKEVLFLEVLDVGNCRKAVKVYCPCGWARCVRRMGSSCTHELRECCPDWYDLKCCAKITPCIEYCQPDGGAKAKICGILCSD
ncbi:hypothetical protein GPALN_011618 [Globodera pallida]|nr:hypothetical protein GPALN_011618 [Globodera pallida]